MNKHSNLVVILSLLAFMATLSFRPTLSASTPVVSAYPKNFIPFWSEARKGYETTLLNTNQIVRIVPIFDPKVEKLNHTHILYLEVHLVDGKVITVEEDFDKFYSRVRVSQSK